MTTAPLTKPVMRNNMITDSYKEKMPLTDTKNFLAITTIEQDYISYYFNKKLSIDDLFRESEHDQPCIKDLIEQLAGAFYRKNKSRSRISLDDFLSVAYERAWNTVINYDYRHYYFLYQHLKKHIRQGCIDVLRKEGITSTRKGNKHIAHHQASDLTAFDEVDAFDLEETLIIKDSLAEAIKTFSEHELKVYQVYLDADNINAVTLDTLCNALNLKHRQQASRILNKLRQKLRLVLE